MRQAYGACGSARISAKETLALWLRSVIKENEGKDASDCGMYLRHMRGCVQCVAVPTGGGVSHKLVVFACTALAIGTCALAIMTGSSDWRKRKRLHAEIARAHVRKSLFAVAVYENTSLYLCRFCKLVLCCFSNPEIKVTFTFYT
jgi:hypothetical protein